MPRILIVGSGILGLSVATYFAKHHPEFKISLLSNDDPLAGSLAAAANLSTKGQEVGRDPHFQIKIEAKKKYKQWILSFLTEINPTAGLSDDFYQEGPGIDFFECEEDAQIQWNRVYCLQNEPIHRPHPLQIQYENEAWVHAPTLLKLLKDYLIFKKIEFIRDNVGIKYLQDKNTATIFCTGAWTPQILYQLGLPLPRGFLKPPHLTMGSTLRGPNIFTNLHPQTVLQEKVSRGQKTKITFSGSAQNQYLSSTTTKLFYNPDFSFQITEDQQNELTLQNQALLQEARAATYTGPTLLPKTNLDIATGLRIGFGHAVVCAGAHKSGFLFAPMVGEIVYQTLNS
jgi:glycine/D-amino acid oxidase-like deaminating enzyme